jgi:CheY-like chemotaxis protein
MNLVINAAEAIGDRPGTIRVQTGELNATAEYLAGIHPGGSGEPGPFVYLDVIDDGAGMDSTTLARIFEPFFSTKFTGRGLGLAAVLGIVRAHGGALSVNSAPGRGTTFRMLLPVSHTPAAAADTDTPSVESEARPGVALVVDDEPSVRAVAQAMLQRLGMETIAADSGEAALRNFDQEGERLALVLMDITMPGMPGSRVAEALRERGATVPIVMMSGYTEQDARARCGSQAPSGFLQKPFSFADMQTVVNTALAATP